MEHQEVIAVVFQVIVVVDTIQVTGVGVEIFIKVIVEVTIITIEEIIVDHPRM